MTRSKIRQLHDLKILHLPQVAETARDIRPSELRSSEPQLHDPVVPSLLLQVCVSNMAKGCHYLHRYVGHLDARVRGINFGGPRTDRHGFAGNRTQIQVLMEQFGVVGWHITATSVNLPPDVVATAQERGGARDLERAVAELLVELKAYIEAVNDAAGIPLR